MVLTQVSHQDIVGISAGLSQAFQFFQGQHKVISEQASNTPLSSRVETNCAFVCSQQFVAPFAVHYVRSAIAYPWPNRILDSAVAH